MMAQGFQSNKTWSMLAHWLLCHYMWHRWQKHVWLQHITHVDKIPTVTENPSIIGATALELEALSIAVCNTTSTSSEVVRASYRMANNTVDASILSLPGSRCKWWTAALMAPSLYSCGQHHINSTLSLKIIFLYFLYAIHYNEIDCTYCGIRLT